MREKLAKYPWYHDALPKEWETMKISIVLRGLLQDVPPAVLTDVESEEAPKIVGTKLLCMCAPDCMPWLWPAWVLSEMSESLLKGWYSIPLQTAKQESEKPENRASVQTTVLGEKKMQLKKIKMNSPWGCQTLYMLILPI